MASRSNERTKDNQYKVKLFGTDGFVTFDVTPDFIETRNVNYSSLEPLHQPGQIMIYKNTSSRNFNISNARMISRTQEEADRNLRRLHMLRGWTMPRFGRRSSTLGTSPQGVDHRAARQTNYKPRDTRDFVDGQDKAEQIGIENIGAPPQVLRLSAYSDPNTATGRRGPQHINRVPVVIQQLNIPYPADVDYIPTSSGVPMPIIMTVDLTLVETHSPFEYEQFSLAHYRKGILRGF